MTWDKEPEQAEKLLSTGKKVDFLKSLTAALFAIVTLILIESGALMREEYPWAWGLTVAGIILLLMFWNRKWIR